MPADEWFLPNESTARRRCETLFGEDETAWPERSPAAHVSAAHPPLMLSVAELDLAPIADQTLDLAAAPNAVGGSPPAAAVVRRA